MKATRNAAFLAVFAAVFLMAFLPYTAAFAKPSPEETAKEATSLSFHDAENIESKGILENGQAGALGRNMWSGSKRSTLVELLENLPAFPELPTMQQLYLGLLLSKADASGIENDIPIENGKDLFTLRLQKLLEYGLYNKASKFYASLDQEPYSAALAKAGIMAYLLNGESSLACLELQISEDVLNADEKYADFHTKINAYCESVLASEIPEKTRKNVEGLKNDILKKALLDDDYSYEYSLKNFEGIDLYTKAVLAATGKINIEKLPDIEPQDIPSSDFLLLYHHKDTTIYRKLILAGEALRRGIFTSSELTALYRDIKLPVTGNSSDQAGLNSSEKLALYYKQTGKTRGKERLSYIEKAFELKAPFGLYALAPFAEYMRYEDWENADTGKLIDILKLIHVTGYSIPSDFKTWLEKKYNDEKSRNIALDHAYLASFIASPPPSKDRINSILDNYDRKSQEFLKNIMKTIDNNMANVDNAGKVYEKAFDLTLYIDYVMPSHNVWKGLDTAAQKGATAETVLWSTYVFRDQPPKEIYPGIWRDVLHGLDAVGLKTFSNNLAVSALLAGKE